MEVYRPMLDAHPRSPGRELERVATTLEHLSACAAACTICADACLAEDTVHELVRCIRLNQDCADICDATARVYTRMTEPDGPVLRGQLLACAEACRECAEECSKHADMHEHCRVCANFCRSCEEACRAAAGVFAGQG